MENQPFSSMDVSIKSGHFPASHVWWHRKLYPLICQSMFHIYCISVPILPFLLYTTILGYSRFVVSHIIIHYSMNLSWIFFYFPWLPASRSRPGRPTCMPCHNQFLHYIPWQMHGQWSCYGAPWDAWAPWRIGWHNQRFITSKYSV